MLRVTWTTVYSRSFQNTTLNRGTLIRLLIAGASAALIAHKSTLFENNLDSRKYNIIVELTCTFCRLIILFSFFLFQKINDYNLLNLICLLLEAILLYTMNDTRINGFYIFCIAKFNRNYSIYLCSNKSNSNY